MVNPHAYIGTVVLLRDIRALHEAPHRARIAHYDGRQGSYLIRTDEEEYIEIEASKLERLMTVVRVVEGHTCAERGSLEICPVCGRSG